MFANINRKKLSRWLAVITVNLLVFAVFTEVLAVGIYFYKDGTFFYTQIRKPLEHIEFVPSEPENLAHYKLHPFFGFISIPGTQVETRRGSRIRNNHGFWSEFDYPFKRQHEDQYIIAVFGGSVSVQFFLQARSALVERLKENEFFSDKEIVVLSFGHGGFKQPQQVQLLTYFLAIGQEFDLVINIDGFNEAALSNINYRNGIAISMPSSEHINTAISLIDQETLTPDRIQALARISRNQTRLNTIADTLDQTSLASLTFVLEQYYDITFNEHQKELLAYNQREANAKESSLVHVNRADEGLDQEVLFQNIATLWADSSILMHDILAAKDIMYIHVLQPNQYYSKKSFSAEEAKIALFANHPYRPGAELGYPKLLTAADKLVHHQVKFYNALSIFDDHPEIIYKDNCCHFKRRGYVMIADYIAAAILDEMNALAINE
jgi:hypothetical protein